MSPRRPSIRPVAPAGGPDQKIEISDIRSKLEEIRGDTDEVATQAKPTLLAIAVGGGVLLVVIAFLLGRKRGQRKATWVEIRRL